MSPKPSELRNESDEELVNLAIEAGDLATGANVEMMRRLRGSLVQSSTASETWSRRLSAFTVVLIVLTAVLIVLGVIAVFR